MIPATEIHEGILLLLEGRLFKVVSSEFGGAAKVGRIVHLKLKSIPEGNLYERSFKGDEKVEPAHLNTFQMEYIYNDGENYYFMNKQTYEQIPISKKIVGPVALFLKENSDISIEFFKGQPVNVVFPKIVHLKVLSSPPGIHEVDSTYKTAVLENGLEVLVPQFIKEGDIVEIEVETRRYLDRLGKKKTVEDSKEGKAK